MREAIRIFCKDVWYWIIGGECPFCGHYAWSWAHDCSELRGLSNKERVEKITAKVRDILKDEPADKFVHLAHEAVDNLDAVMNRKSGAE